MAKKINIKESDIHHAIASVLKESMFGISGADLEGMGLRNPANDYNIDYTELAEKCEEMRTSLQGFKQYIDGVEEDAENGVEAQDGVAITASMKSNWSDDPEDEELANILKEVSFCIYKLESALTDAASQAQSAAQWNARMNSRR